MRSILWFNTLIQYFTAVEGRSCENTLVHMTALWHKVINT